MKLNEIVGKPRARNKFDLLDSIENGIFTRDGSDLVSKDFSCSHHALTSLLGCPKEVEEDFFCSYNQLKSLIGGPRKVGIDFFCQGNLLTSLEGCPEEIGGNFHCANNKLISLKDIHKHIKKVGGGAIYLNNNPITSHVLGLLKIPELIGITMKNEKVQDIINKYLPLGDLLNCQEELIEAGFEEYAQL